jgi:hypothetical protein
MFDSLDKDVLIVDSLLEEYSHDEDILDIVEYDR